MKEEGKGREGKKGSFQFFRCWNYVTNQTSRYGWVGKNKKKVPITHCPVLLGFLSTCNVCVLQHNFYPNKKSLLYSLETWPSR